LLACAGVQALALAAAQRWDLGNEVRANTLFAETRLPQAQCTALDEDKGSAPDRGHVQCPAIRMPNFFVASADVLGRSIELARPVPAASVRV
jgi:hypothetical protein